LRTRPPPSLARQIRLHKQQRASLTVSRPVSIRLSLWRWLTKPRLRLRRKTLLPRSWFRI
jgi:hypothetical protein